MQKGTFAWPTGQRIAVTVTVMLGEIARWVLDENIEAETRARRHSAEATRR